MTEEKDRKELLAKLLGIANGVRKAVLLGNKRIEEAIIEEAIMESHFDKTDAACLLEFIEMFMHGHDMNEIFDALQVSSELADRLSNMEGLHWDIASP